MERSDKMKIRTKILILFLTLNLLSYKGSAQETETKEPKTEIRRAKTLLSKASKAGTARYPEFIVSWESDTNFLIIVECKANKKGHYH